MFIDNDGSVFAFELKLENWKKALYQAYKNQSYAHYSYIVVPSRIASRALKNANEFSKRNVGLCAIDEMKLVILIKPEKADPLLPWLLDRAISYVKDQNNA